MTCTSRDNGRFAKGYTYRNPKPYWNREWLYNEYVVRQRSAADIAEDFGCQENNILYFLHRHGIPTRSVSEVRQIKHWGASGSSNPMHGKTGEDNPNWRGGVTKERQSVYISAEWKRVVRKVWKRDKGVCRRCGKVSRWTGIARGFHIHHIVSFEVRELRYDVNNLVLLCNECHQWVHSKKNVDKEFFETESLHDSQNHRW